MLRSGWAVNETSLAMGRDGYDEPIAEKRPDGTLRFEYSQYSYRYGAFGHWGGPRRDYGLNRVEVIVDEGDLRYARTISQENWRLEGIRYPAGEGVLEGMLPIKRLAPVQTRMPERESILRVEDWYWYIPPSSDNSEPRMLRLSEDQQHTPASAFPRRVAALPFVLVGDILFWPVFWVALQFADHQ